MKTAVDSIIPGWPDRLRLALRHGRFYFTQCPVASLDGDDPALFENRAFLRERGCDHDQTTFLAAAEACHLGAEIDRLLVRAALAAISRGPKQDKHIVSIGGDTLADASFPAWLGRELTEKRVPGGQLVVQLPIQAALRRPDRARRLSDKLTVLGCRFGTFAVGDVERHWWLCRQLGVAMCKLSPDLVAALEHGGDARKRVRELADIARTADIAIIAEGPVNARHVAALWQSGVRLVVGHFLQDRSLATPEQYCTGIVALS